MECVLIGMLISKGSSLQSAQKNVDENSSRGTSIQQGGKLHRQSWFMSQKKGTVGTSFIDESLDYYIVKPK